jgi:hypothetical protein
MQCHKEHEGGHKGTQRVSVTSLCVPIAIGILCVLCGAAFLIFKEEASPLHSYKTLCSSDHVPVERTCRWKVSRFRLPYIR